MRYSAERKNAALTMMQTHSIAHTSNELGIHATTLLRWRKENADVFSSAIDESTTEVVAGEVVSEPTEDIGSDQLRGVLSGTNNADSVRAAQVLLQNPKHVLVGEVALLIAENKRLSGENARLRQALKEMLA